LAPAFTSMSSLPDKLSPLSLQLSDAGVKDIRCSWVGKQGHVGVSHTLSSSSVFKGDSACKRDNTASDCVIIIIINSHTIELESIHSLQLWIGSLLSRLETDSPRNIADERCHEWRRQRLTWHPAARNELKSWCPIRTRQASYYTHTFHAWTKWMGVRYKKCCISEKIWVQTKQSL